MTSLVRFQELINTVIMTIVLAVGTISQLSTVAPHFGSRWYGANIAAGVSNSHPRSFKVTKVKVASAHLS